ncbi:type IV pilin [Haloarchaeobius sp. DFWS5]|uniref:type IV pilin n=1 Tax=Haloarchaeobius sp. DFWS5 TaxID=3446114 RepID=UPI003EBDBDDA
MQLRALFTDDDALSPVIGVVLMVAVTVVLSAAIGAFVLDIGSQVTEASPNMVVEYNMSVGTNGSDYVELSHTGGDSVDAERLTVNIGGTAAYEAGSVSGTDFTDGTNDWSGTVTAGAVLEIREDSTDSITAGQVVQVIWSKGGQSTILSQRGVA